MSTEIEHGIQHLDFPTESPEEKKEPELTHFGDPINPHRWWCGAERKGTGRPGLGGTLDASEVTCVPCLHLYIEKGGNWWWKVNRAWYD